MGTFGAVPSNTTLTRMLDLGGARLTKGVTAPTDATIGTSPAVPVLLFDAVAEIATASRRMPEDWDTGTDPILLLRFALVNPQINNDVASMTLDYTVSQVNTTAAGGDKASSQVLGTTTVTTGNGLAVTDEYEMTLTLPRGDATNPIAAGDSIGMEIHLTNLTGVAAIHLRDAWLRYEAAY